MAKPRKKEKTFAARLRRESRPARSRRRPTAATPEAVPSPTPAARRDGLPYSAGPAFGLGERGPTGGPRGGAPLPAAVRRRLEGSLGADLGGVRVHDDRDARAVGALLGARAYTRGPNIWLGPGASASDLPLMAHEATHVVQQGAAGGGLGRRTARSAGPAAAVAAAPAAAVARGVQASLWDDVVGGVTSLAEAGAGVVWGFLEDRAPRLVPILREVADKGIFGYLRDKVSGVVDHLFDDLDDSSGFLDTLIETFNGLQTRVGALLGPLAQGDCGPLFAALEQLKNDVSEMAGDAWNAITEFFQPVGDFFVDLWESFGAPALDWLREKASDVWDFISELGADIWAWTRPVRDALASAWDWVKEKLGLGEDEGDSEGGLVDWIGDKLGEVWDWVKLQLRPVIEPMQRFAAKVREVLPLDAIVNLRDTIQEWMQRATSMADAMDEPDGVAEQQTTLRGTILPAILRSVESLRERIVAAGAWVSEKIGAVATGVTDFLARLREVPLARALGGAIGWLADGVRDLSGWAQRTVGNLFARVGDGLVYLSRFIEPVLDLLERIVSILGDLAGRLPDLILGPLWGLIPACIRDPIKDFLINQILRRIPIFSSLLELPDIWTRVQQVAMRILRQVFVDGNLAGAAWTFFSSLLELLGLPPELVTNILRKAAQAISDILGDPVGFLINLLRAVKEGFSRFFSNIGRHLLGGVAGWLFGQLRSAGISPPEDLSFRSILGFVMQVLDITTERIFQVLGRHIGEERVRQLRRALDVATGVWSWVATLINEGPAGLWERLRDELSGLWNRVLDGVISWVTQTIIARVTVRLLSMLDPSGVMAVVNSLIAIYRAIQSFMEHLREMLEIVNTVLDGIGGIARGAISQAAGFVENALARAIPVAIGFLANQVGLRNLGTRIREMVTGLRAWVWRKIEAFVARVVRLGRAALGALGRGVGAVRGAIAGWWQRRLRFQVGTESHELYFQDNRLMVASNHRRTVEDYLAEVQRLQTDASKVAPADRPRLVTLYRAAMSLRGEVERERQRASQERRHQQGASTPSDAERKFSELKEKVKAIMRLVRGALPVPPTVLSYHPGGDRTVRAIGKPLTNEGRNGSGTKREAGFPIWWTDVERFPDKSDWKRLHLIHHNWGRGDDPKNLVPGNTAANSAMENIESKAIERTGNSESLWYKVIVTYRQGIRYLDHGRYFPRTISVSFGEYDRSKSDKEGPVLEQKPSIAVKEPSRPESRVVPTINSSGESTLWPIFRDRGMTQRFARWLAAEARRETFTSSNLKTRVEASSSFAGQWSQLKATLDERPRVLTI